MTELDRLEALGKREWPDEFELADAFQWLPDLVRVARAAMNLIDTPDSGIFPELEEALSPLYREVEP